MFGRKSRLADKARLLEYERYGDVVVPLPEITDLNKQRDEFKKWFSTDVGHTRTPILGTREFWEQQEKYYPESTFKYTVPAIDHTKYSMTDLKRNEVNYINQHAGTIPVAYRGETKMPTPKYRVGDVVKEGKIEASRNTFWDHDKSTTYSYLIYIGPASPIWPRVPSTPHWYDEQELHRITLVPPKFRVGQNVSVLGYGRSLHPRYIIQVKDPSLDRPQEYIYVLENRASFYESRLEAYVDLVPKAEVKKAEKTPCPHFRSTENIVLGFDKKNKPKTSVLNNKFCPDCGKRIR